MVGYAEVHLTESLPRMARLQRLCVAPDVLQRGLVGLAMVRELLREAFERLGGETVEVILPRHDWEAVTCYAKAGLRAENPFSWADWLNGQRIPEQSRLHISREIWQARCAADRRAEAPSESPAATPAGAPHPSR